jgi:hypothetical protein
MTNLCVDSSLVLPLEFAFRGLLGTKSLLAQKKHKEVKPRKTAQSPGANRCPMDMRFQINQSLIVCSTETLIPSQKLHDL